MVEVQCETDFVARNEDFQEFAYEVALHVAAPTRPELRLGRRDPGGARAAERAVFEEKAREEGKPDNVVEKIVEGQLAKWAQGGRPARPGARQRRRTRARRSRSCARSWPRRPARTSGSPASPTSASASRLDGQDPERALRRCRPVQPHPAEALGRGPDGRARLRHRRRPRSSGSPRRCTSVSERGVEVAIVVGAGNIYRGLDGGGRRAWTGPPATTWGCWRRCSTR